MSGNELIGSELENFSKNIQTDFKYINKNNVLCTFTKFDENTNETIFFNNRVFFGNNNRISMLLKTNDIIKPILHNDNCINIIQTTNEKIISKKKFNSILTITSMLPDYDYVICDENDRVNYITNNHNNYIDIYNNIIPGAYKADLFRALYIFNNGGIYFDCKNILVNKFGNLEKHNEIYTSDLLKGDVCNGFMYIKDKNNSKIKK